MTHDRKFKSFVFIIRIYMLIYSSPKALFCEQNEFYFVLFCEQMSSDMNYEYKYELN